MDQRPLGLYLRPMQPGSARPDVAAIIFWATLMATCRLGHADSDLDTAQDAQQQGLAEVTVTAERRPANAQTVPLSVATLTSEDLRTSGAHTTADLTSSIPGLEFDQQAMGATPFIRGVGTTNGAVGNESSIAVYLDGIYVPIANAAVFDLENVNQIEVIK
jgi:iron complex outermembrane receptor protein